MLKGGTSSPGSKKSICSCPPVKRPISSATSAALSPSPGSWRLKAEGIRHRTVRPIPAAPSSVLPKSAGLTASEVNKPTLNAVTTAKSNARFEIRFAMEIESPLRCKRRGRQRSSRGSRGATDYFQARRWPSSSVPSSAKTVRWSLRNRRGDLPCVGERPRRREPGAPSDPTPVREPRGRGGCNR